MANTIREQIILAVITKLAGVTIANGYNTDCGTNVLRVPARIDSSDFPAFAVFPKPEEQERREFGKSWLSFDLQVEAHLLFGSTNPSVIAELALGDMVKIMIGKSISPDTTGGLADEISYLAGGLDTYPAGTDISIGIPAVFQIKYKTLIGNPYGQ